MAKKDVRHLYVAAEAVRSVLKQNLVTAACGNTKVLTREGFEAGDFKTCQQCIAASNSDYDEYTILAPRGWVALLEKVWLSEHSPVKSGFYKFTISSDGKTWNFPPAA